MHPKNFPHAVRTLIENSPFSSPSFPLVLTIPQSEKNRLVVPKHSEKRCETCRGLEHPVRLWGKISCFSDANIPPASQLKKVCREGKETPKAAKKRFQIKSPQKGQGMLLPKLSATVKSELWNCLPGQTAKFIRPRKWSPWEQRFRKNVFPAIQVLLQLLITTQEMSEGLKICCQHGEVESDNIER